MNNRLGLLSASGFVAFGLIALLGCNKNNGGSSAVSMVAPGATLKCASSGKDAYDTYGSSAFVAVNQSILSNVGSELSAHGSTNLGPSFGRAGSGDAPATVDGSSTFAGKLAAFLVYAYGGPTSITYTDGVVYQGQQDMKTAHTTLAITTAQYNYFVTNEVVPALTSNGVPSGDVSSCFAPVITDSSFVASIVGQ